MPDHPFVSQCRSKGNAAAGNLKSTSNNWIRQNVNLGSSGSGVVADLGARSMAAPLC
jgi:hypothetical protein